MEQANLSEEVPNSYREALASDAKDEWFTRELYSLGEHGVWEIVRAPADTKLVGCKWVFVLKRNEKGEIVRFKARLVAQGFSQTFGIDFDETYSPVANMASIRMFMALCCQLGYMIEQCDADTAFLYGILKEVIYMRVPEGVPHQPGEACLLQRSLYGLRQASAVWYKTIRNAFKDLGFKQCKADPCIFVKQSGSNFVYVTLYVDDLLIGARSKAEIAVVKQSLASHFKMKDLGAARFVIGMEVQYNMAEKRLALSHKPFILRLIKRFNQKDAHGVLNPCDKSQVMTKLKTPASDEEQERMERRPYRSLIGSLLYIAMGTRPDISFAVAHLSRFCEEPREVHWNAAIRVVRYLKATIDYAIQYRGDNSGVVKLTAWSDADWGSSVDTRKSSSGVLVCMAGGPVIFKSKMQRTVALSSAEAEYMAMAMCAQEVLWARSLLKEMGHQQTNPTTICEDNQSAMAIAKNAGYQARAKHVDIKLHFVRDHLESGNIDLQYVPTKTLLADYLTKALPKKTFLDLVTKSGVYAAS